MKVVPWEMDDAEWVHCVNPSEHDVGELFGWADKRSETGFVCGYIVKLDYQHLRVRVHNLAAGKL